MELREKEKEMCYISKVFDGIEILEQKAVRAFTTYQWPRNRGMTITHTPKILSLIHISEPTRPKR